MSKKGQPAAQASKPTPSFWQSRQVSQLVEILISPLAIGLYVTALYIFFAQTFYKVRSQNESGIGQNKVTEMIFRTVESLDFILTDTRFLIRGEKPQLDSQVALVAIDDDSLEVIGRWPWSRTIMADLVERLMRYEPRAVGLDVIWAEPQENSSQETIDRLEKEFSAHSPAVKEVLTRERARPQPDDVLAETIRKYQDRIVLGVFPTDETYRQFLPYTDYCRNEAFNRVNGSVFVKPDNITLVVEDTADLFEPVKFNSLFDQIFNDIEVQASHSFLQHLGRTSIEELGPYERNRMRIFVNNEITNYCDRWLVDPSTNEPTDSDPYYDNWKKFFSYLTNGAEAHKRGLVTAKFDALDGVAPDEAIDAFRRLTLSHPVPQHRGWTINLDKFHEAAQYSGSFKAEQDNDGKIRKNPLFYRTGNRIGSSFIPSLALQTYLVAHPGYQAQVEIGVDPRNEHQKSIKSFRIIDLNQEDEAQQEVVRIPVDGQGRLKINYAGPQKTYAHISAKDLLNDSPEMRVSQRGLDEVVKKADFLKDKILLVGATAVGIYDLRVTPFDKNFPGPETHVTVLDNLEDLDFIRVNPDEAKAMIWALAILGILVSVAIAYSGPFLGFFIVIAGETGLALLDQALLKRGLVSTMILPALQILSIYTLMVLYKYFTEERKKKELRKTFSKYVSPAIVDEILKSPENIQLGGRKQRMTVFFSDVRGFTTISEKLDPQVLSDVLNRYLTPMTEIVFSNKGTLDKYMGDAVMAFFGAPIPYKDHAKFACRCALQSINKLKEIQEEFARDGLPAIDIGIGINTSEMSVGNMGSEIVRNYTVMGDGVNLGSRLEGINKEYGTRIILSEFTQADVRDSFSTREVDWVRVKGKNEPVRIFELISEGRPDAKIVEGLGVFAEGFKLYHERRFKEAMTRFQEALRILPGDRPSELYIERCQDLLVEPPPDNWDGVYVMKTK